MSSGPDTPNHAVRDRLERAVHALLRARSAEAAWEPAESRERLAHTGERPIWVIQDAASGAVTSEVETYTRALRADGLGARAAMIAVCAVVREAATPFIDRVPLDAMVHDAGRACVRAYFAA